MDAFWVWDKRTRHFLKVLFSLFSSQNLCQVWFHYPHITEKENAVMYLASVAQLIGQRSLTQSLSLTPACPISVGMTMIDNFKCRRAKYRILNVDYHRTWGPKTLFRTLSLNNIRKLGENSVTESLTGMPPFRGYRHGPPMPPTSPPTPAKEQTQVFWPLSPPALR